MAHAFNPSPCEKEAGGSEFEFSLIYRVSSSTANTSLRNAVSKNKQANEQQKQILLRTFRRFNKIKYNKNNIKINQKLTPPSLTRQVEEGTKRYIIRDPLMHTQESH